MSTTADDIAPAYAATTLAGSYENTVDLAAKVRGQSEQQAYNALLRAQYDSQIYNQEIEPEHDVDWYCACSTCNYRRIKISRLRVHKMWSEAVMYPGEKRYHDVYQSNFMQYGVNPYNRRVVSPYGNWGAGSSLFRQTPSANAHARSIRQTITLNNELNAKAQATVDAMEPKHDIWAPEQIGGAAPLGSTLASAEKKSSTMGALGGQAESSTKGKKAKRFSGLKGLFQSSGAQEASIKGIGNADDLRRDILREESCRWPDSEWQQIVFSYQVKVGMRAKILQLRQQQPLQYLHLLRAGYFEPIPVAWADLLSNPLKFSIEAAGGWRGITPAWRGYEDTAEERLYWVLNHRVDPDGRANTGTRLKPDFISALELATQRMNSATEPPPQYFSPNDICNVQQISGKGYSRQVMPAPFRAYDRPETPTDDTMILLDISGSMDFDPQRPVYDQYLIKRFARTMQPKNKDVAKAIVRRFTDAMANHDHLSEGYDMVTFSTHAKYVGKITHRNLDQQWNGIRTGGGTRVMTGWQMVKNLHFQKHHESATWHPRYGWQAGPGTPMLRLLLLLDGEATDMDEFELDLLGLSWAHVTIFLVGAEGCVHHHRHANELSRISDVNHHVSFVDAQGNTPERFVTHELLKRHLGQDLTMEQFTELEVPPAYDAVAGA